ncbi:hypothetical protein QGM71_07795 [Virgibacillus sp. C22-A2]|uniref:Uncharacterized protein n=1 Tax=Virgibacillus tibetensis TaxID=3042313 RepID=A0ABU6KE30_9BACI|nr:hypothetical protein [Virgibacillus sp. C22-A2]
MRKLESNVAKESNTQQQVVHKKAQDVVQLESTFQAFSPNEQLSDEELVRHYVGPKKVDYYTEKFPISSQFNIKQTSF